MLLFVFWYCHKRGRETRLEKERLAAEQESGLASSASSLTDDADSVFGPRSDASDAALGEGPDPKEKPTPPLIISDGKEDEPSASIQDMPSVKGLPDPVLDQPKGEPAKV